MSSLEGYLNSIFTNLPLPKLISITEASDIIEAEQIERKSVPDISDELALRSRPELTFKSEQTKNRDNPPVKSFEGSDIPSQFTSKLIGKRTGAITRIRFSPSCSTVAVASEDATSIVVNLNSQETSGRIPRLLCDASATCLDWCDDNFLGVGTNDHAIHLWSPNKSKSPATIRTHPTYPMISDIAFDPSSPSSPTLVACVGPSLPSANGELQVWNVQSERLERVLPVDPMPARFRSVKYNHNGTMVIAGSGDGMIRVYDANRAGAIMGWPAFKDSGVSSLCISKSETSIYALSDDCVSVVEFSLHRVGDLLRKWKLPDSPSPKSSEGFLGHSITDISTSSHHLGVVANGSGHVLNLSDAIEQPLTIPRVRAIDWDEQRLACGFDDGSAAILTL